MSFFRASNRRPVAAEGAAKPKRWAGLGLLTTGVVCPCHALVGLLTLLTGAAILSPAAQDGVHALYVPLAVLGGTLLWRRR